MSNLPVDNERSRDHIRRLHIRETGHRRLVQKRQENKPSHQQGPARDHAD